MMILMCGGIIIRWQTVPDPDHLGRTMRIGTEERVLGFSYSKNPVLPAEKDGAVALYPWGNRDKKSKKLLETGWCRVESLEQGKWDRLKPVPMQIPAIGGVEKGKWMAFSGPLKGVLVEDEEKVAHAYMLTQAASPEHATYTNHERMPVLAGDWQPMEAPASD